MIADLSALRGAVIYDADLGKQSWFGCGGAADLLFEPADLEDLQSFLRLWPLDQPMVLVGGLANTIVRDGGVRGAVVRLGKGFSDIDIQGHKIIAGAGALNGSVASFAAKNGCGGLEFLSGIPGRIGGAIAMNAGAYGAEVSDVLQGIKAVDRNGDIVNLTPQDLCMSYRHTNLPEGFVIISASFDKRDEDVSLVRQRLKDIKTKRRETQPISEKTGGSTFANPSPDMRAWQVVERIGGRDIQIGGARMSDQHLNFMINDGNARASDLEDLGDELQRRAKEQMDVKLRWEIKRIGDR